MKAIFLLILTACILSVAPANAWVLIAPTPKNPTPSTPTPVRPAAWPSNVSTPNILMPADGAVLHNFPRAISVQWASDGWEKHTVEITCDYCFTLKPWASVVATGSSLENKYTFTLPGDNMYRVRIQSFGPNGQSAWSSYRYFSFKTN